MAVSDPQTRAVLRSAVRRELLDTGTRWWSDAELNSYLRVWQNRVQEELEFVWGSATATITGSTSTLTLTDFASDVLRPGYVFWDGTRMPFLRASQMDEAEPNWRAANPVAKPYVVYQEKLGELGIWPPLKHGGTGTAELWYPKALSLSVDTATHQLPSFCRPSATSFVAYRAYLRDGENNDVVKAQRYKALYDRQLGRLRGVKSGFYPHRMPRIRPATLQELELISPRLAASIDLEDNVFNLYDFVEETPTGAVNGTNSVYTLSSAPNETTSLEFEVDGITLPPADISLSSNTVTLGFAPVTGLRVYARYRVLIP